MKEAKIEQAKMWATEANREMKRIRDYAEKSPASVDISSVLAEMIGAIVKTAAAVNSVAEALLEDG